MECFFYFYSFSKAIKLKFGLNLSEVKRKILNFFPEKRLRYDSLWLLNAIFKHLINTFFCLVVDGVGKKNSFSFGWKSFCLENTQQKRKWTTRHCLLLATVRFKPFLNCQWGKYGVLASLCYYQKYIFAMENVRERQWERERVKNWIYAQFPYRVWRTYDKQCNAHVQAWNMCQFECRSIWVKFSHW